MRKRVPGRRKPLRGSAADIGIAERAVRLDAVAVEQGRAIDEHRTRIVLRRRRLQPVDAKDVIAVLEQQKPERRLGIDMALVRRSLEPGFRRREVDRHAAAEPVSLGKVELRVRIALLGKRAPDFDRRVVVGVLPGGDSGLHRLRRKRACNSQKRHCSDQMPVIHSTPTLGSSLADSTRSANKVVCLLTRF